MVNSLIGLVNHESSHRPQQSGSNGCNTRPLPAADKSARFHCLDFVLLTPVEIRLGKPPQSSLRHHKSCRQSRVESSTEYIRISNCGLVGIDSDSVERLFCGLQIVRDSINVIGAECGVFPAGVLLRLAGFLPELFLTAHSSQ